ncbi:hypothetical protein BCAR13_370044 [Paraburkholderia caribensis]|nr:hypothetical protein BCAR13_370044 [Paraburkholderia caribensis]
MVHVAKPHRLGICTIVLDMLKVNG